MFKVGNTDCSFYVSRNYQLFVYISGLWVPVGYIVQKVPSVTMRLATIQQKLRQVFLRIAPQNLTLNIGGKFLKTEKLTREVRNCLLSAITNDL